MVVIGLQVFTGNANLTNFLHAAFMGIAAYAAAICVPPAAMKAIALPDAPWGLNVFALGPWASALVAITITGVLGLFTGIFVARLAGVGVTTVSIAILVIVHSIFLHRTKIFKGNQALFGIPQVPDWPQITVFVIIAIFATRWFRDGRFGLQLRACAEDEIGAREMGVNVFRTRLMA
nr:branched-chain amino acid ABC transporter permease [Citreicella sp. C3M06]